MQSDAVTNEPEQWVHLIIRHYGTIKILPRDVDGIIEDLREREMTVWPLQLVTKEKNDGK